MEILYISVLALLGLIIGSFLNVCIYRIPNEESINFPPSHCQACKHQLHPKDLVPVFSYLFLKGKCRYCGEKISMQYPIIELCNGLGWAFVAWHYGLSLMTVLGCVFVSVVLVLTLIDWYHMILPTRVIMVGSIFAMCIQGARSYVAKDWSILGASLLGGVIGYGVIAAVFYLSIWLMKKEGMGYGDVRYLGMIGLFTSPALVFMTVLIGSIVGSVYGGGLYFKHKESAHFPFGPFLSIGALISFFYGNQIMQAYIQWCMSVMR